MAFWDINKARSYNALFNFIIGLRNCGKTTSFKLWAANDFLKTGEKFYFIRRTDEELDKSLKEFWDGIKRINPNKYSEFSQYGDTFYYGDKPCGRAATLSGAHKYKGNEFLPNKICFDEFQIEGNGKYINGFDEPKLMLSLYQSLGRGNKRPQVFFFGNPTMFLNPYFHYFKLSLPEKGIQRFTKQILVENIDADLYKQYNEDDPFSELIMNTPYYEYAIEGKTLDHNETFIKNKPNNCNYYFTIKMGDEKFGVWYSYDKYSFHITEKHDPSALITISLDINSQNEGTILVGRVKKIKQVKTLIDSFTKGNVFYESMYVKSLLQDKLSRM